MSELQERELSPREIGANIFSMFVAITPPPGGKKSSRRNPFLKGMKPLPSIETKEGGAFDLCYTFSTLSPIPVI